MTSGSGQAFISVGGTRWRDHGTIVKKDLLRPALVQGHALFWGFGWCTGELGADVPQRSYARRQRVAIVFDGVAIEGLIREQTEVS
jgi:hypothetical protein